MGVKYMGLSNDLLSQFAKITNDKTKNKKESTTYGTVKVVGGVTYVQLDGSDLLTPYSSTADVKDGDRVQVTIKNHNATITGNLSSPSARTDDVQELAGQVTEVNTLVAKKVDTEVLEAEKARIDKLVADNVTITGKLTASEGYISELQTEMLEVNDTLTAKTAEIESLKTDKADVDDLTAITASISELEANKASITDLEATNAEISILQAEDANIKTLVAGKLSATDADLKYANIDFTNIGKAAMEYFYSTSGLIKNVTVGDQTITGNLIGVTISGDLIDAGTVKADKLVVLGEDGLYYKLNVNSLGETTAQSDPKYQTGLDGSVIIAKSITATEINVEDLVAFDATIGGFKITDNSIYSGVKETVNNTTRGIYLDNTGQIAFGDASNFIKFYKDANGVYKLDISARQITFGASNTSVEEVATAASKAVIKSVDHYYLSDSPTSLVGGSWGNAAPSWTDGKYIWRRSFITYGDGSTEYTPSENGVCITGNTGPRGLQGLQGEKGDQGIPGAVGETGPQGQKGEKGDTGEAGQNGKTSYFHIKYSSVDKPTSSSQMTETPSTYIGTYVDYTSTDSTDPTKYTWSRFQGAQGDQGIPGTNGTNGKTSYLHIAYANSADGKTGFDVSTSTNKLYIGQYTDFTSEDSTDPTKYSWTKIKGETGAAGADAISITITSSNGTIFKNNSGSTVLTAHVYKGGVEQSITDAGVCGTLGSIKWYKGTSTTAVATAKTLTVTASDVTNYMAITCQLEK